MNSALAQLIDEATAEAKKNGHGTVEFVHVWSALTRSDDSLANGFGTPDPPLRPPVSPEVATSTVTFFVWPFTK